jgi:hypothetical protein
MSDERIEALLASIDDSLHRIALNTSTIATSIDDIETRLMQLQQAVDPIDTL